MDDIRKPSDFQQTPNRIEPHERYQQEEGGGFGDEEAEQLSADLAEAMRLSQVEEEERQLQAALRASMGR